jgi:hypothetical protein
MVASMAIIAIVAITAAMTSARVDFRFRNGLPVYPACIH